MNKIKTIKSVSKRIKKNKSKTQFKRKRSNLQHILTKKSTKRKRRLKKITQIPKTYIKKIKKCIPNK